MITSVAIQAYLSKISALLREQGFDPGMHIVYDSEQAQTDEWLSDELANKHMPRKGMTTKDDVRSGPFTALFWTRSSVEPIVRQRYRLLDAPAPGQSGLAGKSTVSAKFRIACAFVSNKAEAIEDLEEAFLAVFQNTYSMPLSLQYIYNAAGASPEKASVNFTFIQNAGESDLVHYKEGNLFAYAWSADIFMNCVSEFATSTVGTVEKVLVDLYGPGGLPLSSLDSAGIAHVGTYTAIDGTEVPDVPDEPLVAFTREDPKDYVPFAVSAPYAGGPSPLSPEARSMIETAVPAIGGEVSLRGTAYMMVVRMPLSRHHAEGASYGEDVLASAKAIADAIGHEYVITPMPPEE